MDVILIRKTGTTAYQAYVAQAIARLCRWLGIDAEVLPYGYPDDVVPVQWACSCGTTNYALLSLCNDQSVTCSNCHSVKTLFTDGERVRFIPRS